MQTRCSRTGSEGAGKPARSALHDGLAEFVIATIKVAVLGWLAAEHWAGEDVTPMAYPVAAALPVVLVVQVRRWLCSMSERAAPESSKPKNSET